MNTMKVPQMAQDLGIPDQPLMTVGEVAEYLRVSPAFVRQHSSGLRQPTIPSVKLGKAVRFRRAAVDAFLKQQERAA
jgi:excisionase family DNA binding protein